ncbi:HNH endonuclease [Paenibacillus ehimensis]|uniref:HNH endonuclease n=1 Tax=Paenibacillus ehimensis TaxID=79264 RepID=UPI002DB9BFAA|nr:HNH endonuclease [Paenibacillus ehimensis]MEC0211857.1 HNH endonuclease [Paenibacillus ehimensis]
MKNDYEVRGEYTAIIINHSGKRIETLIDTDDLPNLLKYQYTWCISNQSGRLYVYSNPNNKPICLHRFLMNPSSSDEYVDHINGNQLDNRKCNLRICTNSQNQQNRKGPQSNSKSGVRGVYWHKGKRKWRAQLQLNKKKRLFG